MRQLISGMAVCLLLTVAAFAAEPAAPTGHPADTAGWETLFAGDLSDADAPEGVWSVKDGVLTATKDKAIWSKKKYENFVLDLEFKTAPGTNSGVFVYATDISKWCNSVEIQIADDFAKKWAEKPRTWQCAAIFGRLAAKKSAVKKPGEWNRMTITCRGQMIYVVLNGELVTEMDMRKWTSGEKNPDGTEIPKWLNRPLSEMETKGLVGLQGKHAGAPIYFRNIKIKEMD